ncbi:MAG: S-layer homology domain-containing protein [Clostridia bacterium]|nr:S-layer homology domain-containing protein [Clostridia bacterium]
MSKRILSTFLACLMLLSAFVFTGVSSAAQNPDIIMPMADPVIDGIIEESGAWSDAAEFGEDTVSNFWSGNALNSSAKLYFAYSMNGLYFAADITDNDLIYSTGYDNIDNDYGFNGDVMTLMLDALGLFETSDTQVTPWYNFGIFEDGSIKCFRSRANDADITDSISLAGGLTDKGFRFEALISWNDITADAKEAGGFDVDGLSLIAKDSTSRASAMYMDRYQKNSTTVDTWGRYITVCDTTYDGWAGSDTSGYTAKSFGLVLVNGSKPEHLWGEWTVTKEATCAEEGTKTHTCTDCGKTEEVAIPTTDHSFGDWVDLSGSLRERECSVCGATEQETVITEKKSDQIIVAYFNASVPINAYEFHNIDVINFHPAHVEQSAPGSGNVFSHPHTGKLDQYRSIAREQNPDIKFLFTVANGNLNVFESWFATEPMAEKLADEVVNIVKTYDYDGFDVDYEFPTGAVHRKPNFVHFMKTLKEKFAALGEETGKEYILSMAVPGTQWTFDLFDMNALAEHVSYFNMMNYDLYIGENGKYTPHHHTPAYDNYNGFAGGSVYGDIQLYLERGIPADKIVAGCGLYAHRWTGVEDGGTHGLYQSGTLDYSNLHYTQIKYSFVNKGGYVRYWDEKAGAPYLYNATQKVFISYDDEQSVELKCKITAEEEIRGIMVFDYCTADGIGLFDSMRGWLDQYMPEEDILDQFEDVNKNAWYADAVRYCVTKGYAQGMSDTVFAPNSTLTRAQFVQLLAGIDGVDLTQYNETDSTFKDVKVGAWFHNAITWAVRNNYVAGMSADSFMPNVNLTREQLVRILYNYAADNGRNMEGRADLTVFGDNNKISEWAYEELSWAVYNKIVSGMTATTVGPKGTATRAQAMQIIKQFDALASN